MTFTAWLRTIWSGQPLPDLPPPPDGVNVDRAVSNRWIEKSGEGWRVTEEARHLLGFN